MVELEINNPVSIDVRVYDCVCKVCKSDVEFSARVDADGDVRITVGYCTVCLEETKPSEAA